MIANMREELITINAIKPYIGFGNATGPALPTGPFRNIIVIGWGADYEERFLSNCEIIQWPP